MFNMKTIGKRIAELRRSKNLTQVELADQLGVTYQAVSNWERGDSMPDIAKLGDLSRIFDVSIDELLDNHRASQVIKDIVEEKKIDLNELSKEELSDVLPLVKPSQFDQSFTGFDQLSFDKIVLLLPFLDQSDIDDLALKAVSKADKSDLHLAVIAPFVSSETLDKIVDQLMSEQVFPSDLVALLPFLSRSKVDQLFCQASSRDLAGISPHMILPFVSSEALDRVVELKLAANADAQDLVSLAPFLSESTLDKIALTIYPQAGIKGIMPLVVFMSKASLRKIMDDAVSNQRFDEVLLLAPFVDISSIFKNFNQK